MLGIVILFTAFVSIPSSASGSGDLDSFIKSLKSQNVRTTTSEETSSSSSEARASLVGQLRQMDLGQLVQIANHLKAMQKEDNKQNVWKPITDKLTLYNNRQKKQVASRYGATEQLINQLLQQDQKPNKLTHKQLSPNSLLNPHKVHQDRWERAAPLSDYSKIYVIMDPETMLRDSNSGSLTSWISKIVEKTASDAEKKVKDKNKLFLKGYSMGGSYNSRRFRRDSKEMYGGGGSMEDEYRPKRQRSDHGGGGGGGRTAIPYIKHRGDIYERDN